MKAIARVWRMASSCLVAATSSHLGQILRPTRQLDGDLLRAFDATGRTLLFRPVEYGTLRSIPADGDPASTVEGPKSGRVVLGPGEVFRQPPRAASSQSRHWGRNECVGRSTRTPPGESLERFADSSQKLTPCSLTRNAILRRMGTVHSYDGGPGPC